MVSATLACLLTVRCANLPRQVHAKCASALQLATLPTSVGLASAAAVLQPLAAISEWWEGDMFLLEDPLFNFVSCTGQLRHDTWSPENVKRLAKVSRR